VGRILVDMGSSANVLTWWCFVQMGFTKKDLKKSVYPLIGFEGQKIEAFQSATMRDKVITFDIIDIQ
jgi:hypothetical protein